MKAIDTKLVNCPACEGGIKTIDSVWGKEKKVRCLACKATGEVEAHRICSSCGRFKDMCRCGLPRKTMSLVKLPPPDAHEEESEDVEPTEEKVTGVTWNEKHQRWQASITRSGKLHFLGEYIDRNLAVDIRLEAEALPVEAYEDLKARYRAKRNGHTQSVHVDANLNDVRAKGVTTAIIEAFKNPRISPSVFVGGASNEESLAKWEAMGREAYHRNENDGNLHSCFADFEAKYCRGEGEHLPGDYTTTQAKEAFSRGWYADQGSAAILAPNPAAEPVPPALADLIQVAQAADAELTHRRTVANQACVDVVHAEQVAIDAWNQVADAIMEASDDGSAVYHSKIRFAGRD